MQMRGLKKQLLAWCFIAALCACQNQGQQRFVVQGNIRQAAGKTLLLAELPLNQRHRLVVDSTRLDSTGNYRLSTLPQPECFYQVFVQDGPGFLLINDAPTINLNADASQPEGYKLTGSKASQSIQRYDAQLQTLYRAQQRARQLADSVAGLKNMADSLKQPSAQAALASQTALDQYLANTIIAEGNGTAQYYMLGYAKGVATLAAWQTLLDRTLQKHPKHAGLLALKNGH